MTKYYRDLDRVIKALNNLIQQHESRLSVGMLQAVSMMQNFITWEFEEIKVQASLTEVLGEKDE